jgi:RimJ/RimL family protein N-acetyltransferase
MLMGKRCRLRALDPSDAADVVRWHQDHEFSVLDGNIYPPSAATTEAWLRAVSQASFSDVSLGIETADGRLIGYVRLKRGSPEDRHAEFGIAIERAYWDQGYGTDATRTVLRFAFEEMQLHRVSLGVRADNLRAKHVYEKCGFREEGVLRAAKYVAGGWVDNVVMGVLRDDVLPE